MIVALLAAMALGETAARLPRTLAGDFYQLWSVSAAHRASPVPLGVPYTHVREYTDVLNRQADASTEPRLKAANRAWRTLSPVASPLLFVTFSLFPSDYSAAVITYYTLQTLLFLGSLALLGWRFRYDAFILLCLTFILLRAHEPLLSDMRLGNVGVCQLFVLSAMLGLAGQLDRPQWAKHRIALGTAFLSGLVYVTLFKPSVALVTALLAVWFWVSQPLTTVVRCALGAAGALLLFLAIPSLYFGTPAVWLDWYRHELLPGRWVTGRSVQQGNYSTVAILADWLGAGSGAILAGIAVILLVSLAAVGVRRARGAGALGHWLRALTQDANRLASIAVIATIAMSPLAWLHYYVLLLIPALWLLRNGTTIEPAGVLSALALLMNSGALNLFLYLANLDAVVPAVMAFAWVPLWAGTLWDLPAAPARVDVVVPTPGKKVSVGRSARSGSRAR